MITNSIATVTLPQLRRAVAIREKIEALEKELATLLDQAPAPVAARARRGKRVMSQEARDRIAQAQRERWAKKKAKATAAPAPSKRKRRMSKATRAKIAAATRNRWAKLKAAKPAA